MKKLLFIILFALVLIWCAFGQEIIYYNSSPTLAWDAVTTDINGDIWLPEDTISYGIYIWDTALGDVTIQEISALTYIGATNTTEMELSFPYRSNWAAGVLVSVTDGEGNVVYSELAYSIEDAPITTPGPFVYAPNLPIVPRVLGLRDSGI